MKKYFLTLFLILILAGSVNAWFWEREYLVKVNGEVIELEDFKRRLDELHRQRSMKTEKGNPDQIDFRKALDGMVDDYLMNQEGIRLGLDKEGEFISKTNSYLEFQSVLRLRKEAVKDKIRIKEDEIKEFYDNYYQRKEKGDKPPPDYQKVKKTIRKKIYKQKEGAREEEYLNQLKKKATIEINKDFLELSTKKEEDLGEVIARVNRSSITLRDLLKECGRALMGKEGEDAREIKKKVLGSLVDYCLIKNDALDRNYPKKDLSFGRMISQYRIILMVNLFKKLIIYPQIKISEEDLKEYYQNNREKFRKKGRVKLAIIKVKNKKEALNLSEELKAGADFNRLIRLKNQQQDMSGDGIAWWSFRNLPSPLRNALEKMKPGEFTGVIETPPYYQIVKMIGLEEGDQEEFLAVKGMIKRTLGRKKFQSLLDEYLLKMRDYSSIQINNKLFTDFKKKVENAL